MNGSYQYIWLLWPLAFLVAFALIYVSFHHRPVMLGAALGTAPFGLSEPLFVPAYWNPPSLFDLAQRTGFDLESIIFSFSIGGIGAPGFIEQVWNLPALSGLLLAGIPVEELLFGGAFSLYWAGVHEHLTWTRGPHPCRRRNTPRWK